MGYILSATTVNIVAYLTQIGRKNYFIGDDNDIIPKYFILGDSDSNYLVSSSENLSSEKNILENGFVPDITGDHEGCLNRIAGGLDIKYSIDKTVIDGYSPNGTVISSFCLPPHNLINEISNGDGTTSFILVEENSCSCGYYASSPEYTFSIITPDCYLPKIDGNIPDSIIGTTITHTIPEGTFTACTLNDVYNDINQYILDVTNCDIILNDITGSFLYSNNTSFSYNINNYSQYKTGCTNGAVNSSVDITVDINEINYTPQQLKSLAQQGKLSVVDEYRRSNNNLYFGIYRDFKEAFINLIDKPTDTNYEAFYNTYFNNINQTGVNNPLSNVVLTPPNTTGLTTPFLVELYRLTSSERNNQLTFYKNNNLNVYDIPWIVEYLDNIECNPVSNTIPVTIFENNYTYFDLNNDYYKATNDSSGNLIDNLPLNIPKSSISKITNNIYNYNTTGTFNQEIIYNQNRFENNNRGDLQFNIKIKYDNTKIKPKNIIIDLNISNNIVESNVDTITVSLTDSGRGNIRNVYSFDNQNVVNKKILSSNFNTYNTPFTIPIKYYNTTISIDISDLIFNGEISFDIDVKGNTSFNNINFIGDNSNYYKIKLDGETI